MYLKALEIQGFKSFPDKTVLRFGEDITAVVGPNGSGKSNISDAICWVMGEQSVKSLRGRKMEDVIFGGTEKRGPVGFAQVTLVLDNTEHIFPAIDASEVMVTRRYYRSGESEYYINKQSVRLKDVNELFMDTGLGREGYAIIGQGRIDEILSTRSADRREIFEEAAGISKYRHRKEETERRLERTEENLVRINDRIAELELQVEPLREQAERAKRFLILRDELRLLEISVWLDKLEEIRAGTIKLQADCAAARAENDRANGELERLYSENEAFAGKLQDNDLEQERVREEASELEARAADEDSAAAVLRGAIQHNRSSIDMLEREMADQDSRSQSIREQMADQSRRIEAIAGRAGGLERELEALLEQAREASRSAGSAGEEAQGLRARETLAVSAAADGRARPLRPDRRRGADGGAPEGGGSGAGEPGGPVRHSPAGPPRCGAAAGGGSGRGRRRGQRHPGPHPADGEPPEAGEGRQRGPPPADHGAERPEFPDPSPHGDGEGVRGLQQGRAGGDAGRGAEHPPGRPRPGGEPDEGGGPLRRGPGDRPGGRPAEHCGGPGGGRQERHPVPQAAGRRPGHFPAPHRHPGRGAAGARGGERVRLRGRRSRLIRYDSKYEGIFRNLLGRTVVVEDLDCGIAMARKYQNRFRIVTLDGQVINRGGSMTGGSVSRSAGILSRANELESLRKKQGTLEEKAAAAQREKEEAARELPPPGTRWRWPRASAGPPRTRC